MPKPYFNFEKHKSRDLSWIGCTFYIICAVLFILFLLYAGICGVRGMVADAQCLEHGWKDARLDWRLRAYCIREENEYEIVRPLHEVLKENE